MVEPMDGLVLRLLGSPQVFVDRVKVTGFITSKAEALLYYLAIHARPHNRSTLAGLFWPDVAEPVARKNLRDIIFNLRKLLGDYLSISRQTITLNLRADYWVDVAAFRQSLEPQLEQCTVQQLTTAIALYQGDLLDGFYVREAEAFDEWLTAEREQLRVAVTHAMHRLVAYYYETSAWNEGLQLTQRLLAMESWDEAAHRQQMRLLSASGQRGAALRQYARCSQILQEEFGVEPSAETQALYQAICAGELLQSPQAASPTAYLLARANQEPTQQDTLQTFQFLQRDAATIPQPAVFIGREDDLQRLSDVVLQQQRRIVAVVGMGGQGKTTLVANFVSRLFRQARDFPHLTRNVTPHGDSTAQPAMPPFHRILWYSCQNVPALTDILTYWMQQLSLPLPLSKPLRTEQLLALLFDYFRTVPILLILDNFENFLSTEHKAGAYRRDFVEVEHLLERFAGGSHRGALILISREQPLALVRMANNPAVALLPLEGFNTQEATLLFDHCRLSGTTAAIGALAKRYSGNPLALKIIAETINELFGGELDTFLQEEATLFIDDIRHVLDQQFARLSPLESDVILWLAIEREAITPQQIWDNLIQPPPRNHFFEALRSLQRRFLVEAEEYPKRFSGQLAVHLTMQTVVMEYVTEHIVSAMCQELLTESFDMFHRFLLIKAQAPDYVRQIQRRVLVQPLLRRLQANWGGQWVEQRLQTILGMLKAHAAQTPGYAAANLLHLMLEANCDLTNTDFSGLAIWQADLRQAQLRKVNFAYTDLKNSVFADQFGSVTAVAFSPDNRLLAAGTTDGNIHLWRMSDGRLVGTCRGNDRWVWAIAFSPDGQLLAGGYADKDIRLWDVSDIYTMNTPNLLAALLVRTFSGHDDAIFALDFSPDGTWLASGSGDSTICLWSVATGTLAQKFTEPLAGVMAVAFNPRSHSDKNGQALWQLAGASRDKFVRLWQITQDSGSALLPPQELIGHHDEVYTLAFHPNGTSLFTGSADSTVRCWALATGQSEQILTDAKDAILTIACGNDLIAAAGNDHTIYLWHQQSGQLLFSLSGHIGAIGAICLAKDGLTLASGSFDQSVRLWDLRYGHSIRTFYSRRAAINCASLDPAGRYYVNSGADGTVVAWRLYSPTHTGEDTLIHAPPIAIEPTVISSKQRGPIYGLAFHPHEPYLVGVGEDSFLGLWAVNGGIAYLETCSSDIGTLLSLAASPNGEWFAAGSTNGKIILCAFHQRQITHILTTKTPLVTSVVFSPDSRLLFGSSEIGVVHVWELDKLGAEGKWPIHVDEPNYLLHTGVHGILALAVDPQGYHLAVGGEIPKVELWDLAERKLLHRYPAISSTYAIAFSPNGALMATAGGGNLITVRGRDNSVDPIYLEGHKGVVRHLHFDHCSTRLFSAGDDGCIYIWYKHGTEWQRGDRRHSPGPYDELNIYGATGINGEQQLTLHSLGAIEEQPVALLRRQLHNLHTPLTPLYGRDDDIQLVLDKLKASETRLVTILGEGGVGKTRVALEIARSLVGLLPHNRFSAPQSSLFEDGVWLIPLASIPADSRAIERLIAQTGNLLKIPFNQHTPIAEQLTKQLQERKLLLIFDNAEHLRHYIADVLSMLLQRAPNIKIVITSRHHLDFFAQYVHRLQGLSIPTADQSRNIDGALQQSASIKLFVEQARRVTGTFALSTENAESVLWLCRFMNGLPLGIKLAAAQLVNYPIEEVVERAQRDLSLLASTAADLPEHQRSLHTLLQTSWNDLPPHLVQLLTYCAVFEENFAGDVAARLADVSPNAVDELVHRSLIHPIDGDRYAIHEFVRAFIRSLPANTGHIDVARSRHAAYYAQLLDQIGRRKQSNLENFQTLSHEFANIVSAWQWMIQRIDLPLLKQSVEGFAYLHERLGQLIEATHAISAAINQVSTMIPHRHDDAEQMTDIAGNGEYEETLAELYICYATLTEMLGDLNTTRHTAAIVIDYGKALANPRLEAYGQYLTALQAQQRGQLAVASEWVQQATAIAITHELVSIQIMAQNLHGILHDMQGDHASAMRLYKQALALAIRSQDQYQERLLVNNLGIVALATGHWDEAKAYLERNRLLSEEAGSPIKQTYALMNHALYLDAVGLYEEARQELLHGLAIARSVHHRQSEIFILQFLSLTDYYAGRSHSGIRFAEEALALIEEYQFSGLKAAALAFLGHNFLASDQMERAHHQYNESIRLWRAMNNQLEIGTVLIANAYVLLRLGRLAEALVYTEETIPMLETILANNALESMWVIIGCYFVLQEANDDRRHAILQKGYAQLIQQAESISDPDIRKAFFNNSYPHRLIMRAMRAYGR